MRKPDKTKPGKTKSDTSRRKYPNCPPHYTPHEPHKCPAGGKTCAACKQRNHFAGSPACKSISEAEQKISYTYEDQTQSLADIVEVGHIHTTQHDNTVCLHINGSQLQLFVDSGCKKTLIPYTCTKQKWDLYSLQKPDSVLMVPIPSYRFMVK